jgi:hypothetical protein
MIQKLHLEFNRLCKKKIKKIFTHSFADKVVSGKQFLYLYIIALKIRKDACKKLNDQKQ